MGAEAGWTEGEAAAGAELPGPAASHCPGSMLQHSLQHAPVSPVKFYPSPLEVPGAEPRACRIYGSVGREAGGKGIGET
jgi:hypothetical protein